MNNADRLGQMLGFPLNSNPTAKMFVDARQELEDEEAIARKAVVKELLKKALDSHRKMLQKKREFEQLYAKEEKELGKVLNKLDAMSKGQEPPKEENKEDNDTETV